MIKRNKVVQHIIIGIISVTALLFVAVAPSFAEATVTQGYGADTLLQRGMIVGLQKDDPRKVEPINSDDYDRLHGVVIGANESAVLLGRDDEKVYVASGGRFPVLVSSQNGNIAVGDYVAASSVKGVGMRAGDIEPVILGKAIEAFDSGNQDEIKSAVTVKDNNGNEQRLAVGIVTVDVSIGKNPMLKSNNDLPTALRRASELVAGKPVSPIRVYMSLAILVVATAISGSLIYSAVRSSITAIGRNPLSKKAIMRGLFQVVIIGLIVFISGIFGVYLLLKL
ncbi:MAG TPA: hypothetical protein PLJ04_00920 [Candidatus Saccharibacteria bacterium]|nr:hypothetical protein [Candidatus Saccharibacteria bacterium]MCB9817532.1 hypothetical protein [Candidatus Nomurabacteria bacterium]HPR10119.1 hypothetical protein [Candidatus Saccharibacteria bacterium]